MWHLFGQTSFNLAFCCYLKHQYFNWASVPGGRFSNSPTSQSPVVSCKFLRTLPIKELYYKLMTRIFILIQFLWLSNFSIGQNVEQRIQKFVTDQSIDSFIIYSYPCIGYSYRIDTCRPSDTHYLFWLKDTTYYVRQFTTCKT